MESSFQNLDTPPRNGTRGDGRVWQEVSRLEKNKAFRLQSLGFKPPLQPPFKMGCGGMNQAFICVMEGEWGNVIESRIKKSPDPIAYTAIKK